MHTLPRTVLSALGDESGWDSEILNVTSVDAGAVLMFKIWLSTVVILLFVGFALEIAVNKKYIPYEENNIDTASQ